MVLTLNLFNRIKERENLIFELTKEKSKKLLENELIILESLSYPLINGLDKMDSIRLIEFLSKIKNLNKTIILRYNPSEINRFF
ncbi:P-loop NTPase family protein [Candidatus Nanopusillus massiliensis]|uniref:hypothetical protein n=1 Tax=Candidatus Nanopusillus massiliensis TaxID=2897163 RepID=UPI001E56FACC|nr:hypothetical protein [Candidatus Nanopusillus massiliensis]